MVFESLTEKDKQIIDKYIDCFGAGKYNTYKKDFLASLEYRLRFWNKSKENLFKMLGNQLILKRHINNVVDNFDLQDRMRNYLNSENSAYRELRDKILHLPGAQDRIATYYSLQDLFSVDCLAKNKYCGSPAYLEFPNGEIVEWKRGEKVMRIINKIIKKCNDPTLENLFEEFRIKHSQLFNDAQMEGDVCLSIHPMDYFTLSDNSYDWLSCMSWQDDGEYRAGTIDCLNSPCTLVAYFQGSKPFQFADDTSWEGNKRWRTLVIVDEHGAMTVKGYPYQHEQLAKFILNWVKELAEDNLGYEFIDDMQQTDAEYIKVNDKYYIYPQFDYMYNDFGSCTHYYYLSKNEFEQGKELENQRYETAHDWNLTYVVNCMCCGETFDGTNDNDDNDNYCYVFCSDCLINNSYYCDYCGTRIHNPENRHEVQDLIVCDCCFAENSSYDPFLDKRIMNNETFTLNIFKDKEDKYPIIEIDLSDKYLQEKRLIDNPKLADYVTDKAKLRTINSYYYSIMMDEVKSKFFDKVRDECWLSISEEELDELLKQEQNSYGEDFAVDF